MKTAQFRRAGAILAVAALSCCGALAQVGSPLPSTTFTRQLLSATDSNTAWLVLGLAPTNVSKITNIITDASAINTGTLQPARIPYVNTNAWALTSKGMVDPNQAQYLQGSQYGYVNLSKWGIGWLALYSSNKTNETGYRRVADAWCDPTNAMYPLIKSGRFYFHFDDKWMDASRDGGGKLQGDTTLFPSGMPALISYLHSKGIGVLLYTEANTQTILGGAASRGYELVDAQTFVDWGVDIVKVDEPTGSAAGAASLRLLTAALKTNRWPIIVESSAAAGAVDTTDLWGMVNASRANYLYGDFFTYPQMQSAVDYYMTNAGRITPDHTFNFGGTTVNSGNYANVIRGFCALFHAHASSVNTVAQMESSAYYNYVFTNTDYQAIYADPLRSTPRVCSSNNMVLTYATHLVDGGEGVLVWNRSNITQSVTINARDIGLMGPGYDVRDIWNRSNQFIFDSYTASVAPTNCVLLRFVPTDGLATRTELDSALNVSVLEGGKIRDKFSIANAVIGAGETGLQWLYDSRSERGVTGLQKGWGDLWTNRYTFSNGVYSSLAIWTNRVGKNGEGAYLFTGVSGPWLTNKYAGADGDFTAWVVFKPTGTQGGNARILDKSYTGGFIIEMPTSSTVDYFVKGSAKTGFSVTVDSWNAVVLRRSGTAGELWGDTNQYALSTVSSAAFDSSEIGLGATSSGANPFNGMISAAGYCNVAMDNQSITNLLRWLMLGKIPGASVSPLESLPASRIRGGATTNYAIPSGPTLYITNGVIMRVQ